MCPRCQVSLRGTESRAQVASSRRARYGAVTLSLVFATSTGVPVATIVNLAGPKPQAEFLRFDSFDRGYFNGWDLKSAMHPQTILAYAFNDRALAPAHGAPLRLIIPFRYGARSLKAITDIQFTATTFVPAKPWPT